jgi:membrane fusion protein (multidrug efflux system)
VRAPISGRIGRALVTEGALVELDRREVAGAALLDERALGDEGPADPARDRRPHVKQAEAEVAGAKAARDRAQLNLGYTDVRAPISGRRPGRSGPRSAPARPYSRG